MPSVHMKKTAGGLWHTPINLVVGDGGRRIPGCCCSTSLEEMANSSFSETFSSNKQTNIGEVT